MPWSLTFSFGPEVWEGYIERYIESKLTYKSHIGVFRSTLAIYWMIVLGVLEENRSVSSTNQLRLFSKEYRFN